MLVKSTVLVSLDLTADARQLKDGTLILRDLRVTRSQSPVMAYEYLPQDVRDHAENQLAEDARKFLADMSIGPLGAQSVGVGKFPSNADYSTSGPLAAQVLSVVK